MTRPLEVLRTIVHPGRWFASGADRPLRGVGQDFAGVVAAVGPGVTNVAVGDEVIGLLRAAPWQVREYGSLATQLVISADNVASKPASMSFDVAGGLGVAAQTAMGAMRSVKAEAGDVIVVAAAAGGVGGLVTQLAVAPLPVAGEADVRSYCRGVVAAMVRMDLTRKLGEARAALSRMNEEDPNYSEMFRELMRLEQRRQNYTERD